MILGNKKVLIFFFSILIGGLLWKVTHYSFSVNDSSLDLPIAVETSKEVAKVNGKVITREDLKLEYFLEMADIYDKDRQSFEKSVAALTLPSHKEIKDNLLKNMIQRAVLYSYLQNDKEFLVYDSSNYKECLREYKTVLSQKYKYLEKKSHQDRLKDILCQESIISQYLTQRVYQNINITEEDLEVYYNSHLDDYKQPNKVLIRHILVASEREANKIRVKVHKEDFESFARKFSIAYEAENGGLLGPYAKGEYPDVFNIAFRMRIGDISPVLRSTYGFHIIKLLRKFKKHTISLSDAKSKIKEVLLKSLRDEEYKKWVRKATASASIVVL